MLTQASQIVKLREKRLQETFESTQMAVDYSERVVSSHKDVSRSHEEESYHGSSTAMKKRRQLCISSDDESADDTDDRLSTDLNFPLKSAVCIPEKQNKRRRISNVKAKLKENMNYKSYSKNVSTTPSASSSLASIASDVSRDSDSSNDSPQVFQSRSHAMHNQSTSVSTGDSSSSSTSLISQCTLTTFSEAPHFQESSDQLTSSATPSTAAKQQSVPALIIASPSANPRTTNEKPSIGIGHVVKGTHVSTSVSTETVTNNVTSSQLTQNSPFNKASSSFSVQEKKKPLSKQYLQQLADAERQVEIWIEQARQDLAANQKSHMMTKVWTNIRAYGSDMDEFRWEHFNVSFALTKAPPQHNSAVGRFFSVCSFS